MTDQTVVREFFTRFPKLEAVYRADFAYMGDDEPGTYIVFGSILVPALESALKTGDLGLILPICAFLEDVACAARHDVGLENLLKVEIGKWLRWAENEDLLAPWLGQETKRLCNFVPGLATQRRLLRAEKERKSFSARISSAISKLKSK